MKPVQKKFKVFSFGSVRKHIYLLLSLSVFGVYLSTVSPVVYVGDSGELTAAAFSLGIPHPSGYPLFSLIGKIFCFIPLGNVGFRVNLMSGVFTSIAVVLVYDITRKFTRNVLCSLAAALFLAFIPFFWLQTVSAEVYPLHCFFVAAMIRLLYQWEERKEFRWLLLFVFVTGLSFGNHLQTVMLAIPILYFIISGDKKALLSWRHFLTISIVFVLPLSLYLYLPIRTNAGAPIQWGSPDNFERFWAHVTAKSHRSSYVFSAGTSVYLERLIQTMKIFGTQYGFLLVFSAWGWTRLPSIRWKILFAGIILLDLFYTLFLNIISLEITPFSLPSAIVLTILMGIGFKQLLDWADGQKRIGKKFRKGLALAFMLIPIVTIISNYAFCDQKRNYTAYEHAVNIFRTVEYGSTIFIDGDNNVFPVAYGRIVEEMGEGISLNDRHNLLFKWKLPSYPYVFSGSWDELESDIVSKIVSKKSGERVYFAVFDPNAVPTVDGYQMIPCGTLKKMVPVKHKPKKQEDPWAYYSTDSYRDNFARDYMTSEVTAYHFFRQGEDLWEEGKIAEAMKYLKMASEIAYNNMCIHSDLGIFFTNHGFFRKAREELIKALKFNRNSSGIQNNWGYYYYKRGDYEKAVAAFRKAISLTPEEYSYYNNLGVALKRMGLKQEAAKAFRKSIAIKPNQPRITKFINRNPELRMSHE